MWIVKFFIGGAEISSSLLHHLLLSQVAGSAAHWGVVWALEPVVVNGLQIASDSL